MNDVYSKDIGRFVDACHKSAEYGLQSFSSGNMSCRVGDGLVLMSASRCWLKEITAEQVAVCDLETGDCVNGLTPSVESVFHLGILRKRSDVNVVFHFQSPWATAICCGNPEDLDFYVIPEIPAYIGRPSVVPCLVPGSMELAEATIEAMKASDLAILKNHGFVTVGVDCNDAIQKAGFFELACRVMLTNHDAKTIPPDVLARMDAYRGEA